MRLRELRRERDPMTRRLACVIACVLGCGVDPPATEEPAKTPDAAIAAEPPPAATPLPTDAATTGHAEVESEPPPTSAEPDPDGWVRGQVQQGDSLARILGRRGVTARDVAAIASALEPFMDPAALGVGDGWGLRVDTAGAWVELELATSEVRTLRVARDEAGSPRAEVVEIPTEVRIAEISATIDSSLWAAVTGTGEDAALVAELVDMLASHIDFYTDPRKGDRIAVLVEKHYVGEELVRYGRVLAATYDGGVGRVQGVLFTAPGAKAGDYFTPAGESLDRTLLKSPLKFTRVSSGFDPKRMHPVLHRVKAHFGVDYAAPTGTPVWAAAEGTIRTRADSGAAGNMVVLEHDGGFQTVYMHLDRFAKGQAVGDRVRQKTVIGYVGATGRTTGAHLHFGVKKSGRWVDPATVRSIARPGVPSRHRTKFREDTRELVERLDALLAAGE